MTNCAQEISTFRVVARLDRATQYSAAMRRDGDGASGIVQPSRGNQAS
jgi:hypothetical protein